jgi:hypothetical protein
MNKYYSTDEEQFYAEVDDVIQDYTSQWDDGELVPGVTFAVFEGDAVPVNPSQLVRRHRAEYMLEDVQEELYEQFGEGAHQWPEASSDQIDALHIKLQAAFVSWLKEHDLMPKFFRVKNVIERQVKITAVSDARVEWEWVEVGK